MTWRFAASTGSCTDMPIVGTLEALHDAGITAVELGTPPRHFDPWHHDQVHALGERLQQLSILPVAIHAPFGGPLDLSHPDAHNRHAAMGAILAAASALRQVGGFRIVVHATDVVRDRHDVDERLSHCRNSLRVLARACGHMDVTLLVETPLPHLIGGHPDELAAVMAPLDRSVGVCFDTSHATLGGHWDRLVAVLGDRLMHVHANDHRGGSDDHLAPGEGVIDWRHIRETLKELRFSGWTVLELACPPAAMSDVFRRALARAHELFAD